MTATEIGETVIQFTREHEAWAAPVILVLAFCESFAFVSLVVPATIVLFGIGGLIGAGAMRFWPAYLAAVAGAFAGDWLAYELALRYGRRIGVIWPLSRDPELLNKGLVLFERWGILFVFVGRFFGPLRAVVPLVAGIMAMSRFNFQVANLASALIWAAGILVSSTVGVRWLLG